MKYSPRESTIIDVARCLQGDVMSLAIGNHMDLLACDLLKEVNPEAFDKLLENRIRFNNAWCRPDRDMPAAKEAKREGLKLSHAAAVQIVDAHPELITPSGVTWEAHQKKTKEPTVPEMGTVTLNNSLTMSIVEHVNYDTGAITYTVKGKRLSGTVTLSPCYSDSTETTPSLLWVESDSRSSEPEQHDILTINGIPISCRYSVDLEGKLTDPYNRHFQVNRAGSHGWNDLPDVTRCYAENVLEAFTNLWIKRTDTDDLLTRRHSRTPPSVSQGKKTGYKLSSPNLTKYAPNWTRHKNVPPFIGSFSANTKLNSQQSKKLFLN
jgi:hypothetical protein